MSTDLLTVVTTTVGDSAGRLEHLCAELRRFTHLPFTQIICDDGTLSLDSRSKQRIIAGRHRDCLWTDNPGPTWGVSYNLNHALSLVKTPWVYLVEDGLRPSWWWLETAIDAIYKIGSKRWQGFPVGMIGFSHVQDWQLAMGKAIPTDRRVIEWYRHSTDLCYDHFYGPWNDGYWCWKRLIPGLIETAGSDQAGELVNEMAVFRGILADGFPSNPDPEQQRWLWWLQGHWPLHRHAYCGWYPGAFMLVNMDAWRAVGKFRDGCTFFEGHLGTRMGMGGYLSLCCQSPLWLHQPNQGFKAQGQGQARSPCDHRDTDEVFRQDFQGLSHMDAPNVRANAVISLDVQRAVNEELKDVQLDLFPGWEAWL